MLLSLVRWVSRPLGRFLRFTWMSRIQLLPAGLCSAIFLPRRKKTPPKADTRISLEMLETRFVPQDMMGVLHTGMSLAGAPLLTGSLLTPAQVLLDGWDAKHPSLLPAKISPATSTTGQKPLPEPAPGQLAAMASLTPSNASDGRGSSAPGEVHVGAGEAPAPQAPRTDYSLASWLDSVGAFLDSPPAHPAMPAAADAANTNGGGGGGGSSGPSSGLNSPADAPPMRGGSANVPDANSAAQMTQPPASAAPVVVPTGGGIGPVRGSGQGHSGPVASPDDAGGNGSQGDGSSNNGSQGSTVAQPSLQTAFGQTPLPYELNVGQSDPSVLALTHSPGFGFWLTDSSMVFSVPHTDAQSGQVTGSDVFTLNMVGSNPQATIVTGPQMSSWSSYFVGSDSSKWVPDVAQYSSLTYQGIYPNTDLVLQSQGVESKTFDYNFVLHPGADLSQVQLSAEGVQSLQLDDQGRLLLGTSGGNVIMDAPVFYQTIDGQKQDVAGSYVLGDNDTIGFAVTGSYDATQPLVLDPAVSYSTYLGGSGTDYGTAIAVDQNENSYITGSTTSSNFPTVNGFQSSLSGSEDIFVTKLSAGGASILYSTYLGGTTTGGMFGFPAQQTAKAISVNAAGVAVIAGSSNAADFPTTSGAYDTTGVAMSYSQGVVVELNATGDALDASTYLGSADGVSSMGGIPTTAGAFQTSFGGGMGDAFVTKLDPGLDALIYSTYLGGNGADGTVALGTFSPAGGLAIDSAGDAFITGQTSSTNFPVTAGAYQSSLAGSSDAFVAEISPDGSTETYGTYIGQSNDNAGHGIAVDVNGQIFVTGETDSSSFPTTSGAYQTSSGGGGDAFALSLNAAGTSLVYSTYLGGPGADSGYAIAVDNQDQATVTGVTDSASFPITSGAFLSTLYGSNDAFVTRLTPTGTLSYSSYIGSTNMADSGTTVGFGVALDPRGDAYLTGLTSATTLVGSGSGVQPSNAGGYDAFAMEVLPDRPVAPVITGISPDTGTAGDGITSSGNLTILGTAPVSTTVTLELEGTGVLSAAVPVSAGGTWSYDYSATTLANGQYSFQATDINSAGNSSDRSPYYVATVSGSGPTVTLTVDSPASSLNPNLTVQASDALAGFPANATVTIDVDLNDNGNFTDSGEMNYATFNLGNAAGDTTGNASVSLPTALPSAGTYRFEARITDRAAVQGTSAAVSTTVTLSSDWPDPVTVLTADPLQGDWTMQLGDVGFSHSLDLDQSPGTSQSGDAMLVYHSSQVSQNPIVQTQIAVPGSGTPATFLFATLTLYNANSSTPLATNTYIYSVPTGRSG